MTRVILVSSEGCRRMKPRSIQRCAPMPTSPTNSTATSSATETAKARTDMLRQNQIGTIATMNIITKPTANRFICGSAQGENDPPATE